MVWNKAKTRGRGNKGPQTPTIIQVRNKREINMQVFSGFSVHGHERDRTSRAVGLHGGRGRKGFQDASVPPEKEISRGTASRYKDIRSRAANVSIQKVLAAISRHSNIEVEVLTGRKRDKIIMPWRQLAYLLSYQLTGCTLTQIGQVLNRDHTSLMHGIKQINKLRVLDQYVELTYQELRRELS